MSRRAMAQGHNTFVTDCDNYLYRKEQSLNLGWNVNSSLVKHLYYFQTTFSI